MKRSNIGHFKSSESKKRNTKDIDIAVKKGKLYDPSMEPPNYMIGKTMGIDPGYGSSPFGICIVQWKNHTVEVLYAEQFERPDYNDILQVVFDQIKHWSITKIYVDGYNAAFVKSLKRMLGGNEYYEKYNREEINRLDNYNSMKVIPVSFSLEHKQMLQHTKIILEKGVVAINPKYDK